MDQTRAVVSGVITIIVAVTLVSGPLVGAVDLTDQPGCEPSGAGGTADIAVESLPDEATITTGRFGSETYYLSIPDAVVTVSNVSGHPLVSYRVSIPTMGRQVGTTAFLCPSVSARQTLSISRLTLDNPPEQSEYEATLRVTLKERDGDTVVREKPITVEVQR
ncbi:hypothetical protein [Halapricum desulfuricans]|uniref:Uncharacterized protein n=1 Tax=Halapricum desulfuricans TaxID=2841257 RepID=A0A897N1G7_9EURY|nr:hypothetical protein [Halapricum desulfuricans]QSG06068.1 Uncharacterized protein HSR121_1732 [Halapricum desulfuricans]